jgi:hypothetical protein
MKSESASLNRSPVLPVIDAGRYVILWHHRTAGQPAGDWRGDHYDWMFEVQGELLTWATEQWPSSQQAISVAARLLAPHRLMYLDYEGDVSGDRGSVQRVASGQHQLHRCEDDRYEFSIQGDRTGTLLIYRTRPGSSSDGWTIEFEPNREARPTRVDAS